MGVSKNDSKMSRLRWIRLNRRGKSFGDSDNNNRHSHNDTLSLPNNNNKSNHNGRNSKNLDASSCHG